MTYLVAQDVSEKSGRARVPTGYGRLDEVLGGGFLSGSMVVLRAPACDEVPILLRDFLRSEQPSLLIAGNLSSAQAILQDGFERTTCLVCSEKPVPPTKGMLPGKGVENLTDLNFRINDALASVHPKRVALTILSDILLRHKALQTRRWLNELLERLRSRGITTLAILNSYMHTVEEAQAVEELFNGDIEVFEKDLQGRLRKFLRIKWIHGIEVTQREFRLEGLVTETGPDENRIAVLPFANFSPDANDEYFADGMTEEVISTLSKIRGLRVIARTSVLRYKGEVKSISQIARELMVGTILEGSVRKAGDRLRITIQLIDSSSEEHLWVQNYDRQLEDVFAIQSEIAEQVAGDLRIRLVDSEKRTLEKKPTENTEAYTYFLRGRELLRQETEASVRQAITLFENAIALDPKFARAHVGLAECHQSLGNYGYESTDVSLAIVKKIVDRALNLDPNLSEAHSRLAEVFYNEDDAVRAEDEARKALELNPSLPDPYDALGELAALKGDLEEMVRQMESAYHLDPIRPRLIWRVGLAYLNSGRREEAFEHWKKTEELAPEPSYRGLVEYYISKGDLEKAEEFYAKAEKLEPTNPRLIWLGGYIAGLKGDRERASLAIKRIEGLKIGPIDFNFFAYIYYALGDLDSYFGYLNKTLEAHTTMPAALMYSPLFAKARADPRHPELVERLRKQSGLTK